MRAAAARVEDDGDELHVVGGGRVLMMLQMMDVVRWEGVVRPLPWIRGRGKCSRD